MASIFEVSPGTKKALERQSQLIIQLKKARSALDETTSKPILKGGGAAVTPTGIPKAIELKLPRGLIGFDTFAQKMQDAFLKTDDPQMKMLGLLDADKVAQKQQLSALEAIAANTAVGGNNPTLKLAT